MNNCDKYQHEWTIIFNVIFRAVTKKTNLRKSRLKFVKTYPSLLGIETWMAKIFFGRKSKLWVEMDILSNFGATQYHQMLEIGVYLNVKISEQWNNFLLVVGCKI